MKILTIRQLLDALYRGGVSPEVAVTTAWPLYLAESSYPEEVILKQLTGHERNILRQARLIAGNARHSAKRHRKR